MMNSLVGYGVSSESESDAEAEDVNTKDGSGQEEASVTKPRNFLLESGSASSDSEPEEEDLDLPSSPSKPRTQEPAPSAAPRSRLRQNKLPPPALHTCFDSSVFTNPFKAQADQKLCALQKHVPLTIQAKPSHIGGKRVCVAYRKDGRCRFGIKCKFAHDSDLQTPVIPSECHPPVTDEAAGEGESHGAGSCGQSQQDTEEEESEGQKGKKRKVGLSNTLIPPKRALKQYAMQKDRERINMS